MAKSFKEFFGTGGFRMGTIDAIRPTVSLGKTDRPPKRNGRTADARAVGLTADLYSDDNPADTVKGTGYGDAEAARKTLRIIKSVGKERQMQIVNTMYNRAKHHANRTSDMEDAMKIFKSWIDKHKLKETPLYNYILEKGVIKE